MILCLEKQFSKKDICFQNFMLELSQKAWKLALCIVLYGDFWKIYFQILILEKSHNLAPVGPIFKFLGIFPMFSGAGNPFFKIKWLLLQFAAKKFDPMDI